MSAFQAQMAAKRPERGESARQGDTLLEMLSILFRDGRRIGAVFLGGLVLTVLAAVMAPKKYVADAALMLRIGREYVYKPEVGEQAPGNSLVAYDREQTVMAETRILTSREVKEAVISKMGAAAIYPGVADSAPEKQRVAAMTAMETALEAELLKGSNLIQVNFAHPDPEIAARVLSEVIDAYLQRRSVIFASSGYGTALNDFVLRTIQLNVAEAKLAAFKKERRIRAFGEEQSLLLAQRNTLEQRQADTDLALAQARGRAASLSGNLALLSQDVTLFSETQRSEALENARKLLLDLKLRERDLSSKYVDDNFAVQDVRADIERTGDFIANLEAHPPRTVRSGRSPARDTVEADFVRAQADSRQAREGNVALSSWRDSLDKRLAVFAAAETELPALERERKFAEINYESAAKRLRDEQVTEDLDRQRRTNVSIVQAPGVPLQAKSLRPVILVVGFFLSVCAALLTAFISAWLRDTFLTPAQLERRLGLPMLAAVPERTL